MSLQHPDPLDVVDVIVVGAGVAGLHAGVLLQQAGLAVAVIEGRDRSGGRLLSVGGPSSTGGRLDLGATWFWDNEPRICALIEAENLETFAQHLAGDTMVQGPDSVRRFEGNQIDAPSGRLVEGMQAVTDALERRLSPGSLHLGQRITAMRDADANAPQGELVVKTPSSSWRTRHVIVAAPPATAVQNIDFGTLIDANVMALAVATPVWMGATTKVVIQYPDAFWRKVGLAGAGFSHVGPLREIHDMSGPGGTPAALFGFAQMGSADTPEPGAVIAQLVALFGSEAAIPSAVHILDWRFEELTSPPNATALTNYETFGHRLYQQPTASGRIHWASTETAMVAPGHIEGALAASERAARAVAADLDAR